MAAEYVDLPDAVRNEVLAFADINVAWLIARTRADIGLYDERVQSYQDAGLIPA
jgi:TetR/AcrR family transcriptional repressor of nem operon